MAKFRTPKKNPRQIRLKRGRPRKDAEGDKQRAVIEKLRVQIIDYINKGNFKYVAAAAVGIAKTTMEEWLENDKPFFDRVSQAEALAEVTHVDGLDSSPGRWQSHAWWLERKARNRWGADAPPSDTEEDPTLILYDKDGNKLEYGKATTDTTA